MTNKSHCTQNVFPTARIPEGHQQLSFQPISVKREIKFHSPRPCFFVAFHPQHYNGDAVPGLWHFEKVKCW